MNPTLRDAAPAGNGGGLFFPAPTPALPHEGGGGRAAPGRSAGAPLPLWEGMGEGAGRIRLETCGVGESVAREALRLGAMKLPVTTRVVIREDW